MPGYWVISPVESKNSEAFDKVWQYDLDNNVISIGWSKLGDVSKMSREEIASAVASVYPGKPPQTNGLIANMLWNFYHEIAIGDFVVARRGRKVLAAVGKVTEPGIYAPGRNPATSHPNFLGVAWQEQPRDKVFPNVVFPMPTLSKLQEIEYRQFLETTGLQAVIPKPVDATEASAFVLEKYLQDFIVSNFDAIFQGKLKIYKAEEQDGQQFPTEVGLIDILAIEPETNSFVVMELKKGRPSDQVVGQILRYMGWAKSELCKNGQGVKGLVICRDPDPKLTYALVMTNNIDVRYYSVSFKLKENP